MKFKTRTIFVLAGLFIFMISLNYAAYLKKDFKGSKDHDLISRFAGSIIRYYEVKKFDEYTLPLGKLYKGKLLKSKQLEGKITRILYKIPEDHSPTEIFRNYKLALQKSDFKILFSGKGEELGKRNSWPEYLYKSLNPLKGNYKFELRGEANNQRYLSAKLSDSEKNVYIALCVSLGWNKWPMVQLDIIESKSMETGQVTVNMDFLKNTINKTGHVAVYGIYFDTNKADVKPESEPVFREIAKLLQNNSELRLYVVGHTDNTGNLNYNMELSQNRANSVIKKLIAGYGIKADRLKAFGVGPMAPVTSNRTEEGCQKNRRVELVKQ